MEILHGVLLCLSISLVASLPTSTTQSEAADQQTIAHSRSFASDASQKIATNLLKSNIDIDGNQVHSPLGVTSILAVLAEGSAGDTYEEFHTVFGYPKERSDLRASFKRILGVYKNRECTVHPSFQTWLYVYRNYSARPDFKQLVRDHYFVEVKDISREEYDWSEPNTSLNLDGTTVSNSKDVVGFETLKRIKVDEDSAGSETKPVSDTYGEEVVNKEASKFDRVVDDKQYVEKPVILEEIKRVQEEKKETVAAGEKLQETTVGEKLPTAEEEKKPALDDMSKLAQNAEIKEQNKRENDMEVEDNETVKQVEKMQKNDVVPIQELLDSNEPEKVSIPLQKLENAIDMATKEAGEIMIALETHIRSVRRALGARSLFRTDDITSALSANSITGRSADSKTKMLLFNGLYYRGNWAQPFFTLRSGEDEHFFMTAEDAMKTPMMHTKGNYKVADMPHLNAKAICLPYENKKYAMLVIIPNELEGLRSVIDKLQTSDFKYVKENAQSKEVHITMPKFQVEETSRSETMLKGLGLKKLFSREEADLSLLSDDHDLHVDEIVQFVSVRVDEGGSSENGLTVATTINSEARNGETALETIDINRPFLYFVMDCEEEFVIASGKVYTPEIKDDLPISLEVEFQQS